MKILILNKDISSKIIKDDFNNDKNNYNGIGCNIQYTRKKMAVTKINSKNNILFPYAMGKWEAFD